MRRTILCCCAKLLLVAALSVGTPAVAGDPLAALPETADMTPIVVTGRHRAVGPDALGTATVDAGVTLYDARFRRVAAADNDDPTLRALAARLAGLDRLQQLRMAKTLVGQKVTLTDDLTAVGVYDYWDNAGETLRRGRGDGEDIAIAEMRVLMLAGFPASDLHITVGRHRTLGAHAVLIARVAGRHFLLDATEPAVLEASHAGAGRFTPVLSIGQRGSWIHGRRRVASAGSTSAALMER